MASLHQEVDDHVAEEKHQLQADGGGHWEEKSSESNS